jgi:GeoRSP system radical SAM/SPASM protein
MNNEMILKAPLTINWAVTNKCNFKCKHCYSRTDPSEELDGAALKACIDILSSAGVLSLNFGGGEPLLRPDLALLAQHASKLGLRVSMNSNGFLIDRERAEMLKRAGFSKVGVSIDSRYPSVHDSFRGIAGSHERALRALRHLHEVGIKTSVSSVICRINHEDISGLVALALEHKASQLNFHNFKCSGLGYSNRDELDLTPAEWKEFYVAALKAKREISGLEISLDDPIIASLGHNGSASSMVKGSVCGKLSLNIKSNGDVTPCGFIPIVIGNITRDDFKAMWKNSTVLQKMRHKVPTGKCAGCSSYEDCLGGCSARALAITGDFNNPDPHCWI